jgi:hypothetical protein
MHRDNIQQEPNLMDPEDREAFLYDAELHGWKKLEVRRFDDSCNARLHRYLTKKGAAC